MTAKCDVCVQEGLIYFRSTNKGVSLILLHGRYAFLVGSTVHPSFLQAYVTGHALGVSFGTEHGASSAAPGS